jgi:hypothetical protein
LEEKGEGTKNQILDRIAGYEWANHNKKTYEEWSAGLSELRTYTPTTYISLLLYWEVESVNQEHKDFIQREIANYPNLFIQHFNIPSTEPCWSIQDIYREAAIYNNNKIWDYPTKDQVKFLPIEHYIKSVAAPRAPSPASSLSSVSKFLLDSSSEHYSPTTSGLVRIYLQTLNTLTDRTTISYLLSQKYRPWQKINQDRHQTDQWEIYRYI